MTPPPTVRTVPVTSIGLEELGRGIAAERQRHRRALARLERALATASGEISGTSAGS